MIAYSSIERERKVHYRVWLNVGVCFDSLILAFSLINYLSTNLKLLTLATDLLTQQNISKNCFDHIFLFRRKKKSTPLISACTKIITVLITVQKVYIHVHSNRMSSYLIWIIHRLHAHDACYIDLRCNSPYWKNSSVYTKHRQAVSISSTVIRQRRNCEWIRAK